MKKIFNISKFLSLLLLLVVTSCKKDVVLGDITFEGSLEQPTVDESDADAKNYLANERYIYWDNDDQIKIYSVEGESTLNDSRVVNFNPRSDARFGDCALREFNLGDKYYAIYPATCAVDDYYSTQINMPNSYRYRTSREGHADLSYGRPGLPMVAWYQSTSTSSTARLDFHSVCGIARIQMYASGENSKEIESILFEECASDYGHTSYPISGNFTIEGITQNDPFLSVNSNSDGHTIEITDIDQTIDNTKLFTFYLPLPALNHNITANKVTYYIKATVTFTSGDPVQKAFKVDIRRNCLSYLKAIDLDGTSAADHGMVGCGTELRPFQIYDVEDLKAIRTAFASASETPTINGQAINSNTYFRLVNSQIKLSASETDPNYWASGITNFTGHFICANGNATTMGIENNSNAPIFESVSSTGVVDGLYVRGNHEFNGPLSVTAFSPLCNENNGTLKDCQNYCVLTGTRNFAGVCLTNNGTIKACANNVVVKSTNPSSHVAGVCLTNGTNGKILACTAISNASADGGEAAAICHNNQGNVKDCQVTYNNIHLQGNIGGIVYVNNGTIDHCEVTGNALMTQGWAGGICCINNKTVNGCGNGLGKLYGKEYVGGIVASQTSDNAEIRNCLNIGSSTYEVGLSSSATSAAGISAAGGIVGFLTAGYVRNCFCSLEVQSAHTVNFGTIVGYTRGTKSNFENCLDNSHTAQFYGYAGSSSLGTNCFTHGKQAYTIQYPSSTSGYSDFETVVGALNSWVDNHSSDYYKWSEQGTLSQTKSRHRRK